MRVALTVQLDSPKTWTLAADALGPVNVTSYAPPPGVICSEAVQNAHSNGSAAAANKTTFE